MASAKTKERYEVGDARLPVRFWSFVAVNDSTGCWEWTGGKNRRYAITRTPGNYQKQIYAHRLAYQALVGPITDGLQLDHLCRICHCVNPSHLEQVTARVNILRGKTLAPLMQLKRNACAVTNSINRTRISIRYAEFAAAAPAGMNGCEIVDQLNHWRM